MSVKVAGLTKIYETQKAVDNISFELMPGEIVGFLGPNGAGKSTTMKMITSYLQPTSGKVSVCGHDVESHPLEVRRHIGYLPEANPLYHDMYVREFLEFTAGVHQLGKNGKTRIEEMIAVTGLGKEAHKKISALSKGYKQRVGLAQAMLHDPDVLILDEPTSGLDPNQILEIRDLIKSLGSRKTVLLSTHIMQEVQAMCSRVIIINNGRLVADDSIERLQQMGTNRDSLVVTFEKEISDSQFSKLLNVQQTENLGGNKWKFTSSDIEALKKEIMHWSLAHDNTISSLQTQTDSLEDVFRNLTRTEQKAAGN